MATFKHPLVFSLLSAACCLAIACGSNSETAQPNPMTMAVASAGPEEGTGALPPSESTTELTPAVTSTPEFAAESSFAAQCGAGSCYSSLLIDDFADEVSNAIAPSNGAEGYWYVWPEEVGGPTLDDSLTGKISASAAALPEFGGGIGVGFNSVAGTDCPADLSSFEGIRITAQSLSGADEPMVVSLPVPGVNPAPQGTCEDNCFDSHSLAVVISADGGNIDIPFSDVSQEGWGTVVDFSPAQIQAIQLKKKEEGGSFNVEISRVELYGDSGLDCSSGAGGAAGGGSL